MPFNLAITNDWRGNIIENSSIRISLSIKNEINSLIVHIKAPYYGFNEAESTNKYLPKGRLERLWEYEVVELFISHSDTSNLSSTPYTELIVGPHGHYLLLKHTGQGDWSECIDTYTLNEVSITLDEVSNTWSADVTITLNLLPSPLSVSAKGDESRSEGIPCYKWAFNVFAIHGNEPNRTYMSYQALPGDYPNFHQLKYLVPLILPIGD